MQSKGLNFGALSGDFEYLSALDESVTRIGRAPDSHRLMSLDFDTIYRRELAYVLRTLRRLAVPESDLDDAAHEVFLDIYEKLPTYDRDRPLRPWLFGFAYRVARDFKRRRERRHTQPLSGEEAAAGELPDDLLERRQQQRLAIRCLAMVAEEQAAVLILHDLDGIPVPEIARSLSIPVNTTYSRLRLARQAFEAAACKITKTIGR